MKFELKFTKQFILQLKSLEKKDKNLIKSKVDLIFENPFRFKKIHSKKFNRVFRVRLKIKRKEMRLIYVVKAPNIIVVCLINRKKGYKDLEKYLSKVL
jgi:mRNA-degrading endonuclease RelE of RelBE toxin-antitoxin system